MRMADLNNPIKEDLKDLRTKTTVTEIPVLFKKKLFGGLNKDEVNEYITSLTQQFSRTEDAYKERIDEFTTFTEMLSQEKERAVQQMQGVLNDLAEQTSQNSYLKGENEKLQKTNEEMKIVMDEMIHQKETAPQATEDGKDLVRENELLKGELEELSTSRDLLAGENSVLKKQLELMQNSLQTTEEERDTLKNEMVENQSRIRQSEMKTRMTLSEYSDRQIYSMNRATQNLQELISALDSMKNDVSFLTGEIKENKI